MSARAPEPGKIAIMVGSTTGIGPAIVFVSSESALTIPREMIQYGAS
jgi:hypothetical protein